MLQVQRLLFATDLTESADRAFVYALYLARRYQASLHFLNVVPSQGAKEGERLEGIVWTPEEMEEVLAATPTAGMPSDGAALLRDVDIVQVQLLHAAPSRAVVDYAEAHDVDLLVMGAHGKGAVRRFFSGHFVEEVLRHAPCPILSVRGDRTHELALSPARILAAVDLTEHHRAALVHAAALAEEHGARLEVLHVVDDRDTAAGGGDDRPRSTAEAEERLSRLVGDVAGGVEAGVHVVEGDPAPTIAEYADRVGADLVVLATHGHTGVQRTVMGSIAEEVVRASPSPVLTVRTDGRSLVP